MKVFWVPRNLGELMFWLGQIQILKAEQEDHKAISSTNQPHPNSSVYPGLEKNRSKDDGKDNIRRDYK